MAKISNKTLRMLSSPRRDTMEAAFNLIYDEYAYLLYYIALKIVKNADIAKEIVNESFLVFYEHKDDVTDCKRIKYYLTTICHNLAVNYHIKDGRYQAYDDDLEVANDNQDHFTEYLQRFEGFLNEEEIDLIVFHLLYGYSFKEMAMSKKVSTNVIAGKYRRALIKIRKHYQERDDL